MNSHFVDPATDSNNITEMSFLEALKPSQNSCTAIEIRQGVKPVLEYFRLSNLVHGSNVAIGLHEVNKRVFLDWRPNGLAREPAYARRGELRRTGRAWTKFRHEENCMFASA